MDAQNLNITTADRTAESVAEDVKTADTPWMTKEEVQQKTDAELLQMIQRAQGAYRKGFYGSYGLRFLLLLSYRAAQGQRLRKRMAQDLGRIPCTSD